MIDLVGFRIYHLQVVVNLVVVVVVSLVEFLNHSQVEMNLVVVPLVVDLVGFQNHPQVEKSLAEVAMVLGT